MNLMKYISHHSPVLYNLGNLCLEHPEGVPVVAEHLCATLGLMVNLRELRLCEILPYTSQCTTAMNKIEFVKSLTNLRFVSVSGFRGSTEDIVQALEQLPYLETLDLTSVWETVELSENFSSLRTLWLSSSNLNNKTMVNLSRLPNLTDLDLSLATLSEKDLQELGKSTSLRTLNLSFCRLRPRSLSYLTSLHSLSVGGVSQISVKTMSNLTNLTFLNLSKISATEADIAQLCKALPKLVVKREIM